MKEQTKKDNELMKRTLETISDMKVEISDKDNYIRDVKTIKAMVKTVLAVVE